MRSTMKSVRAIEPIGRQRIDLIRIGLALAIAASLVAFALRIGG